MNNSPTEAPAGATRYSVIKIVASVFLVLLVISVCLILLQGCIVWCTGGQMLRQSGEMGGFGRLSRRRSRRRNGDSTGIDRGQIRQDARKVDLSSLPSFVFAKTAPNPNRVADCAVCLSEFQDGDTLRLLPNCNHSFHTACVDLWFASHSTCPLCRSPVSPNSATATPASSSCPCQHSSVSVS